MHKRIYYSCKKCGWKDSIIEAWSDLKPKRCPRANCKTNFRKDPDLLIIELPKPEISAASAKEVAVQMSKDAGEVLESKGDNKHGRIEKAPLPKRVQTPQS